MDNFSVGEFVLSLAGRDKGKLYIVYKVQENYLLLVDGKARKINNPKLKKLKHIQKTNKICEELNKKWTANEKVLDALIRKSINLNFL